jgi:CHASE1-domain containing sensor protein/two-component sensor histidine kinase
MAQQSIKKVLENLGTPAVVFVIGLAASILVTVQVARISAAQDQERFEHAIAQTQDNIRARLETYVAMLRAGAGFLSAEDRPVDREQFHRFAESLQLPARYPGIQGIGFSARLHAATAAAAEQELSSYGVPELKVHPAGVRSEIHAIVHLEPMDRRNQAALGYDMYSEPVRREAMQRARDSGLPAASGRVQLVQEIDEHVQPGFLIYVPVYEGGQPPLTERERRQKLVGFIYSPFRADDLMRGIFGSTLRPRVNFEIYDGKIVPGELLHRSSDSMLSSRLEKTRTMDVAGRQWIVRYTTRSEFEDTSNRAFVPFVLLAGLLGTSLLTLLSWRQARAKARADAAGNALGVTARRLEVLHATAAHLAAELDPDRLIQAVTDAGRELSGAEIGAFFYNVVNSETESYQLFALSGAPREAFAGMGMPRKTEIFGPTFNGEAVIRSGNITADPRFGKNPPHSGFPAGHWPVRSYLAVPVVSRSGEVLGGLFFGHSQVDVFTESAERSIVALAGHAAIALDNARLFRASQEEIAARKKIEAHQKLLLDELNHRVKNTLAIVQSMAAQTLRSAPDTASFQRTFEARLVALSAAHNLLASANWEGAELFELVMRELAPYDLDHQRVSIEGAPLWLAPSVAVTLGMAIHELAVNALKHGALSVSTGTVQIEWHLRASDAAQTLQFIWQERNGPPVGEPNEDGFGLRMIKRSVEYDLDGQADLLFEPAGFKCVLTATLPLRRAAA